MQDVMLDLETMGDSSNAAIISIGAVIFDPLQEDTFETIARNNISRCFHVVIDLEGQQDAGREINASTIYWWLDQTKEAQSRYLKAKKCSLDAGLLYFTEWLERQGLNKDKGKMWGYGATFDNVILNNAYKAFGYRPPVSYRQARCLRTLAAESGVARPEAAVNMVAHDALDDARIQTIWLQQIYKAKQKWPPL